MNTMKIDGDIWIVERNGPRYLYNSETLKVLASISSWTHPGISPDISAEEKLAKIQQEVAKILV